MIQTGDILFQTKFFSDVSVLHMGMNVKVRCHRKIVDDVIKVMGYSFPNDFLQGLYRGVVDADIYRDRYVHRHTKRGIDSAHFYSYVDEAAKLFRDGNHYDAGHALGIAIHIAQDLAILRGSSGWHNIMERYCESFE